MNKLNKFICLLLSFIVFLSCFATPVSAADKVSVDNEEIIIRKGLYSKSLSGSYYSVTSTSCYSSSKINHTAEYIIQNSYANNTSGEYYLYFNFLRQDKTPLVNADHDCTINFTQQFDYFVKDTTTGLLYDFNVDDVKKIEVGYQGKDGTNIFIDTSQVYLKASSNGTYSINIDMPYQDQDVYLIYARLYFNINDMCDTKPYGMAYGVLNGVLSITTEQGDKTSGLLSTILEWLEGIWNGITNLPELIRDKLSSLFNAIGSAIDNMKNAVTGAIEKIKTWLTDLGNAILDGLKSLFIPSDTYFESKITTLEKKFEQQFGVLLLPVEIFNLVLDLYNNIGTGNEIYNPIGFELFGVSLFEPGTVGIRSTILNGFNALTEVVGFNVYNIYLGFIDVVIILLLLGFIRQRFNSIIGDTGAYVDDYSSEVKYQNRRSGR